MGSRYFLYLGLSRAPVISNGIPLALSCQMMLYRPSLWIASGPCRTRKSPRRDDDDDDDDDENDGDDGDGVKGDDDSE